ncbi:MAG: hypothetical protein ACHQ53_15340 [Polyangiales bacterium]
MHTLGSRSSGAVEWAQRAPLVLAALGCLHGAGGCGASQGNARASEPSAQGSGGLAMREPGPRVGPSGPEIGQLQPVPVPVKTEPGAAPPQGARAKGPPPIRIVATRQVTPVPLRGRDLVLPGGLVIHDLPSGVTARVVREQGTGDDVIELVDARGRRLALVKETRPSQLGVAGGQSLLQATAETHEQAQRSDWGPTSIRVVVDRFRHDALIYVLERRATGTDWIQRGLELARPGADRATSLASPAAP